VTAPLASPADVAARYDELAALAILIGAASGPDVGLTSRMAPVLAHEAALLDDRRFEEWLAWWADDAVMWVPLGPGTHPARDQSLWLDDRRRLAERVGWRRQPSAWAQQPASTTVRVVGSVQAWRLDGHIVARSAALLDERRAGNSRQIAVHQIHQFVGEPGAPGTLRTKILVVPELGDGVPNPSALL
jgi:hypothetical protein